MIRPDSEISDEVTPIPATPAKARTTGNNEYVARAGASSVKV